MLKPWFLRSKPKIILPEPAPDDSAFGRGPLPDDLLADVPWVAEFDLFDPAQTVKVRLILRGSTVKGQTFFVCRATDALRKALATFSNFPTSDEVSAAVVEPFGGGPLNLWATLPHPQLLKTYHVPGPAKRRSEKARQQESIAELKMEITALLLKEGYDQLQQHPELFAEFAIGFLAKELDVEAPTLPSFEEQIIRETMRDPAWREEEAERILDARKVEAERIAEFQRLDDLLSYLKKVKRTVEVMGYTQDVKPNAGAGLDELLKTVLADGGLTDILEAVKTARHPRSPAQAPQASPDGEPPHAEEQTEAANGAHDSQVAENLPPNRPPQSPAPQESPIRENPGGGTGPRRFDIGVPAEELGLLGVGGDTTFVDWPLV